MFIGEILRKNKQQIRTALAILFPCCCFSIAKKEYVAIESLRPINRDGVSDVNVERDERV